MEAPDTSTSTATIKRKRTSRPRANPTINMASSSSTSSVEPSPTIAEEEEDMANCLMLLAQGRSPPPPPLPLAPTTTTVEKFTSRKFTEAMTTAGGKAGFYVYECKTCNKCFPSFQALGGHRASHKKPKLTTTTTTLDKVDDSDEHQQQQQQQSQDQMSVAVPAANSPNKTRRVHECSICGAEFSSGQALGGHMRRHRPIVSSTAPADSVQDVKKNVLSLDLNLPAPADESSPFSYTEKQQRPMLFSAMVDCHY